MCDLLFTMQLHTIICICTCTCGTFYPDTNGTEESAIASEVSSFQRLEYVLFREVSSVQGCSTVSVSLYLDQWSLVSLSPSL